MKTCKTEFSWVGSQADFVDELHLCQVNDISVGRFGGNSAAGQYKNEDGCLIWADDQEGWEFAVLLDAHHSAESAELVMAHFSRKKEGIQKILSMSCEQSLRKIEFSILKLFRDDQFMQDCRNVKGETACLIVLRKNKYLWWFSIGDCILFLFHPQLAGLGQYQVNQRQYYEWVGQVNTFEQPVPCYSSGVRELRKGNNRIVLTTDGLTECPGDPYSDPENIYKEMENRQNESGVKALLKTIKEHDVRDSTTIISWDVSIEMDGATPSDR